MFSLWFRRFVRHRCLAFPLLLVSDVFATSTTHTIGLLSLIILGQLVVTRIVMVSLPLVPAFHSLLVFICAVVTRHPTSLPSLSTTHTSYSRSHHSQTRTHTQSTLRSHWFFRRSHIPPTALPFVAIVDSAHPHTVPPRIWHYTRRADVRWACTFARSGSARFAAWVLDQIVYYKLSGCPIEMKSTR